MAVLQVFLESPIGLKTSKLRHWVPGANGTSDPKEAAKDLEAATEVMVNDDPDLRPQGRWTVTGSTWIA